jgi:iron complex outermembrane receptor protein
MRGIPVLRVLAGASALVLFAPEPSTAASEPGSPLEEIVVTARRREEALQQVPLAIQAFTDTQLTERAVQTNSDLAKLVPSLSTSFADRSDEQYTLRGLTGYGAGFSGQQVTVPIYLSEVPLPIGDGAGPGRFFDLQNVQVLKGPQGTLFGQNSTGGAVLLAPRRPGNRIGGYAQGQYTSYDGFAIEAALNVPVVADKLALRAAGLFERRKGFTHNAATGQDLDDRNDRAGRFSALFTPVDSIENLTVVDVYRAHTNGTSNHISNYDPGSFVVGLYQGAIQAAYAQKAAAGPRTTFTAVQGRDNIDSLGVSNTTTWKIAPEATFKNIFGYRRFEQLHSYDYDGSPITLIDFDTCTGAGTCNTASPNKPLSADVVQYTEEAQLQGTLFDRLTYTAGFFYLHDKSPNANYQHLTTVFGTPQDTNVFFKDTSTAGYGQLTYDLSDFVSGLKVTGGFRRTHVNRTLTVSQVSFGACTTGTPGAPAANPAAAPQCTVANRVVQNVNSYTVGADYQVTPDALVYVNHRRGFREGGVNPFAGALALANPPLPFAQQLFTYRPEILTDIEGGIKADWRIRGMSLRTNLAVFHSHLKDAQIYQTIPVGTLNPFALTNATSADINGVEVDAVLVPVKGLEFRGSYAYTDAGFNSYLDYVNRDPATQQPSRKGGRPFPFSPKHKFDVSGRYWLPLDESLGEVSVGLSWSHKSKVLLALVPFYASTGALDPAAFQKSTNTLDLSVSWTDALKTGLDATFFVTNLTDTTYVVGGAALINSLGTDQAVYNEPRIIGIRLRKTFGGG